VKIVFYHTPEGRERKIAEAFAAGAKVHGDQCVFFGEKYQGTPIEDADGAVLIGVKGRSRLILDTYRTAGKFVVYLDKAFFRACAHDYLKVSVNAFQPLEYLMLSDRPADRWERVRSKYGLDIKPPRNGSGAVVYLGPSQKYARFHRLGDATEYAMSVLDNVRKYTDRPFVYRPKASWNGAVPIPGALFSRPPRTLWDELKDDGILIVHGSNASADATIEGYPVISLGPSIASPVSESDFSMLNNSQVRSEAQREYWARQVAYCQWTLAEFYSGQMWKETRALCH